MNRWLSDCLGFADDVLHLEDEASLIASFETKLATFGLSSYNCGEADLAHEERTVFVATNWSDDVLGFYRQEIAGKTDPTLEAMRTQAKPFTWNQLRSGARDRSSRAVFDALDGFGWSEGLGIPLHRGGSRRGIISLAGQRPELLESDVRALALISMLFYERLRGMRSGRPPSWNSARLTPREIEALHWAASGRNDGAIGERMKVAASTAHELLERAKRKLRVHSRAEAIAIAVSLGLVVP